MSKISRRSILTGAVAAAASGSSILSLAQGAEVIPGFDQTEADNDKEGVEKRMPTLAIHGAEHHRIYGIYFTDLAHRATKLAVERHGSDYLVSLTSDSPIAVHVCIGLPGYGYTWLTADNAGEGYLEGSRELWPELLDSQLARCRAFAEREGCSLDLDTALELAEQEKYAEALTVAVLSGEAMAVAHAKHKLARRAANSELPRIASTVFDCGPNWRTLDPMHKPQIVRPDEQWKMVAATANATVLPCFWGWVEHERGHYRWEPLDRIAAFADQHGMALKSFAVYWGGSVPPWFKALSFKEQLNAIERWATALVSRYRGQVDIWEIVNEMHDWGFANPMRWSQDQLLTVTRIVSDLVAALDPGKPRVINHCLVWGHYVQSTKRQCWSPLTFLDDVLAADIPFEGVGLQWIVHTGKKDVRTLLDCVLHLERFIALGKDIYLTEMGAPSSSRPRDPSVAHKADVLDGWRGPWSPEGQADWLEHWYTIAASYPQVKFMNWWDFADGTEFILNGGLVDRDGRAKPAYRRHQAFYRSLAAEPAS